MRKIFIDCLSGFFRTAVVENGKLSELVIEEKTKNFSAGNIYIGVVKKILPSQFAFIDIGDSRNAFLQLNDSKQKNNQDIKHGREIVVQIIKEGSEIKAPALSSMITISGKYVVMLFNDSGVNISKKIDDLEQRNIISDIAKKIISKNPGKFGIIMRTNCVGADEKTIIDEAMDINQKYDSIIQKAAYCKAPAEVFKAESEFNKIIRDLIKDDSDEIVINDIDKYNDIISHFPEISKKAKFTLYNNSIPMFDNFFIEKQIQKAFHNKIWLDCGGFLIFDYTEACVVIDVNTGKYSKGDYRKTVFNTNIEAAKEAARQIRLRNLSGIIIIDFVDMKSLEDKLLVEDTLKQEVKKDRVGVSVVGMTELGIMQITRKKVRQPLYKLLTSKCPTCGGLGFIFNERFISDKIKNEILSIFSSTIYNRVILSSNPNVINAFKGINNDYKSIEKFFNAKIEFNVIITQKLDYYKIDKFKDY